MNQHHDTPPPCQITNQDWSVFYHLTNKDGEVLASDTIFVIPIATGYMKNGAKVLLCRNTMTGVIVWLQFKAIKRVAKVSKTVTTIDRDQYIRSYNQLRNITEWGTPSEWQPLPGYKTIGQDIANRVVHTQPLTTTLY